MNNNKKADQSYVYFFSSTVLEKKRLKTFPCLHKVKEKLFDIDKCVLERFLKL